MFKVTNLKDKLPPSESSSLKRPKVSHIQKDWNEGGQKEAKINGPVQQTTDTSNKTWMRGSKVVDKATSIVPKVWDILDKYTVATETIQV